jgi:hypothetical protein
MARRPRRAARSFWRSDQAKGRADMRLTCGSHVVGGALTHRELLLAFGSPRAADDSNRFRAPAWTEHRLPKFANFVKCRCRAQSAAYATPLVSAKPAIPGAIDASPLKEQQPRRRREHAPRRRRRRPLAAPPPRQSPHPHPPREATTDTLDRSSTILPYYLCHIPQAPCTASQKGVYSMELAVGRAASHHLSQPDHLFGR